MNEQEQQIHIEQPPTNTTDTTEDVLGSTALIGCSEVEVTPLDDQIPRSWSLHLSGVDLPPITKL